MAQHDLGASCTAHRNCHSDARISGHVAALQGGASKRKPTIRLLHCAIRKRQSSYSQRVRSIEGGGVARSCAVSRVMGAVLPLVWW